MKKFYVLIFSLLMSIGLGFFPSKAQAQVIWDGTINTSWYDDSSTEFYIFTPEELAGLAQLVNEGNDFMGKTIYLEDDIWLNATNSTINNWTMIGGNQTATSKETYANPFRGTFHGNGHYIYNMYCSRDNGTGGYYFHAGLFGDLNTPCLIDSLVIVNPITRAKGGFQGGLASCISSGGDVTISKILVINANINQNHSADDGHNGAIIGGVYPNEAHTTYITNCAATGSVYGAYSGGLTGGASGAIFTNCYFAGTTAGGIYGCGGIASHGGTMVNCYSPNLGGASATNGISIDNVSLTDPSATLGDAYIPDCLLPINGGYPILEFMICNDPSCGPVTGLTISDIQGSSAQISWTASNIGSPMDYTLEYMENGTNDWMSIGGINSTSYFLEDLNPNTLYQIRVMSNCDDGSSSDFTLGSFRTSCMCGQVTNITVDNITGTSAQFSWSRENIGTIVDYTLEYSEAGMENWISIPGITTNSYLLGGLEPSMAYDIRIFANCDNGFFSTETNTTILTHCLVSESIDIGNGTETNCQFPVNNFYGYSYTQQIFTAAEMNFSPQTFNSISFEYAYSSPSTSKNDVNIYLGHTTMTGFSSTADYVPFDSLQLVYSGNLNCQQGWNEFFFNTPFNYNGTDNLVVVVDDNSNGYNSSSCTFYTHSTNGTNMCHALYSDNNNPDPTNLSSFSGNNDLYTNRNNIKFHYCNEGNICAAPSIMITNVTSEDAEIVWAAGYQEYAWELEYKMSSESEWTPYGYVYSMDEIISGLVPNTTYDIRMRSDCGGEYSNWAVASFTTNCGPITQLPFIETFDTPDANNFVNCWSRYASDPSHYVYMYGDVTPPTGHYSLDFHWTPNCFNIAIMPAIDDNINVSDLMASFWIQRTGSTSMFEVGVMTDKDDYTTFEPIDTIASAVVDQWNYIDFPFSQYTGTGKYIAFRVSNGTSCGFRMDDITLDYIPSCWTPSNFTVSNITATSVDLSWTPVSTEIAWIVEYKSDTENDWNVMNSYTTSLTISDLDSNTTYSFRIKADCGGGDESNFSAVVTATTLPCSNACIYVINMTDMFSDGWNGNAINVISNGMVVGTATIDNGNSASYTYYECDNAEVSFTWVSGNYADETSFVILDADGNTLYSCSDGSNLTGNTAFFSNICGTISCPTPSSLTATNVTTTSVTLSWVENGTATEWNIVYGTPGFNPNTGGILISANTNPFTVDNLAMNSYEFYVQSNCDVNDQSVWCGPLTATPGSINMPVSGSQTVNLCGGHIYDNGGANGNYSSDCNGTLTINPDATGLFVHIIGTYNTEEDYDELTVYDGTSTNGTILGTFSGSGSINITSVTGPLTLYFSSDYGYEYSGFDLTVSCENSGATTDCLAPTNVTISNVQNHSADIAWTQEPNTATSWDVLYKPSNNSEWLSVTTTSNPHSITDLLGSTTYDVQVVAHCTNGQTSVGSEIAHFTTTNVGVNEYYLDGNISVFPNPTTGKVTIAVQSTEFNVENVNVYDVYGKLLNTVSANDNSVEIDLSQYAAGIYILRVSTENGMVTKRIVKK